MKKRDLFAIFSGLNLVSHLGGSRFSYAVSKNKKILLEELKTIEESAKPREDFQAYDSERVELCKNIAKKNENGEPVMIEKKDAAGNVVASVYDIADFKAFNKEHDALREKHSAAILSREEQLREYEKLLDETSDVSLFPIKSDIIPEEITPALLDPILELIEE